MCGIFGYVGEKEAQGILLDGLRQLEYRGYDSAGIYVGGAEVVREVGKVAALEALLQVQPQLGHSGIAHTRWATHGVPSVQNAHPHSDSSGLIHLVHNGIIENWQEIKTNLLSQGIQFTSDTDSEVLAQLISTLYKGDLKQAVANALVQVRGTYGLVVMCSDNPDELVVARMGSPIVIGLGVGEFFISSDPSTLLQYTKDIIYLDDGEMASVTKNGYSVTNLSGHNKTKKIEQIDWEPALAQKDGYEHFMLKEIFEAPEVIRATIRGRLITTEGVVKLGGLEAVSERLSQIERLMIVGCGSAYYSGLVGRLLLEEYADLPVEVELGSEYRYKKNFGHKNTAVLAVTQSGETADTLASIRLAKEQGQLTLGVVNVVGSTISRETEAGIHNHAGPEIAVASTKAFVSQLVVFVMLSVFLGRQRGLSGTQATEILEALEGLPQVVEKMVKDTKQVKLMAKKYAHYQDMMYIGRKFHAPIAYEGSLKLKEVSYIHAEAYAGGELKHGSIAMLGPDFPVLAIAPKDDVFEKMLSNIAEVRARMSPVLLLTTDDVTGSDTLADDVILMPKVHLAVQPIVSTILLQLFAYYVGVERGLNVDQPRNLAKSVTVE